MLYIAIPRSFVLISCNLIIDSIIPRTNCEKINVAGAYLLKALGQDKKGNRKPDGALTARCFLRKKGDILIALFRIINIMLQQRYDIYLISIDHKFSKDLLKPRMLVYIFF
jgi:hypothetical protein